MNLIGLFFLTRSSKKEKKLLIKHEYHFSSTYYHFRLSIARVRFRELRQNFSLDPLLEFQAAIKETLKYLAQTVKTFFEYFSVFKDAR